jgi:hypothetical protein
MREDTHADARSFTETTEPLNIDSAACASVLEGALPEPVETCTWTRKFIVPFNEVPSITPQIEEGERRNRAKKKAQQEVE